MTPDRSQEYRGHRIYVSVLGVEGDFRVMLRPTQSRTPRMPGG